MRPSPRSESKRPKEAAVAQVAKSGAVRIEKDTLGPIEVPADAYWGVQTQRAIRNFPVSGLRESPALVEAYVHIKRAAALANKEAGALDAKLSEAIVRACEEILEGKLRDQFVVDVFQAGAGTSFNMNVNEVIANRANELLGGKKGEYRPIHPNDHVNMAQSTNDTMPTAIHLACLRRLRELEPGIEALAGAFRRKAGEFQDVLKGGRTHLQDAMPITMGQHFAACADVVERAGKILTKEKAEGLLAVALGGTAVGTGTNITKGYRKNALRHLSEATGFPLRPPSDPRAAMRSAFPLAEVSAAMRNLAVELSRVANDLRLMDSGPMTGIGELRMPPVQPGSSIMPGKVNPVMAECLNMICFQLMGCDHVVALGAEHGQFEINVFWPVIAFNLIFGLEILGRYLPHFAKNCIEGIEVEREICARYAETSPALATVLNPLIGYAKAAEIAKEAVKRKVSIRVLLKEKGFLSDEEIEKLFDPRNLTGALDLADA
jgi:aspartate ammonia-lyase